MRSSPIQAVARIISAMTYSDLMQLAGDLASMKDEDVRPKIETREEFASALYDWAEATVSDMEQPDA